jgi:hypothetical protein
MKVVKVNIASYIVLLLPGLQSYKHLFYKMSYLLNNMLLFIL